MKQAHRGHTKSAPAHAQAQNPQAAERADGGVLDALRDAAARSAPVARLSALQRQAEASVIQRLSAAQIIGLGKQKRDAVQKAFGAERFNLILKAAPDEETLRQWVVEMRGLHQAVATAEEKVKYPGIGGPTEAEQKAVQVARDQREAQYRAMLAVGDGDGGGPQLQGAAAANAQAAATMEEADDGPPDTLRDLELTSYELTATKHGDFVPRGSGTTIRRAELLEYVERNDELRYLNTVGPNWEFGEDLGESNNPEEIAWCLVVLYRPDTRRLRVTHFGPFGPASAARISGGGGSKK